MHPAVQGTVESAQGQGQLSRGHCTAVQGKAQLAGPAPRAGQEAPVGAAWAVGVAKGLGGQVRGPG